jgi:hypothetical protein
MQPQLGLQVRCAVSGGLTGRCARQGAGAEERQWRSPATDADEPADPGAAQLRPAPINGAPANSPHRAKHTRDDLAAPSPWLPLWIGHDYLHRASDASSGMTSPAPLRWRRLSGKPVATSSITAAPCLRLAAQSCGCTTGPAPPPVTSAA